MDGICTKHYEKSVFCFLLYITISPQDVIYALSKVDPSKACGPDSVSPQLIKEAANKLSSISTFFKVMLPGANSEKSNPPCLYIQEHPCIKNYFFRRLYVSGIFFPKTSKLVQPLPIFKHRLSPNIQKTPIYYSVGNIRGQVLHTRLILECS